VSNNREDKLKEEKIKLLYEAIKDNQNIISRLDTKARFYLAIYFVISGGLLSGLFTIFKMKLYQKHELLFSVISFIVVFLLGYLIYLTIKTIDKVISPKSNPAEKIIGSSLEGFYHVTSKGKKTTIFFPIADDEENMVFYFDSYKKSLDRLNNLSKIESLLLFELLKISLIRDEKIKNMKDIEYHLKNILVIIFVTMLVGLGSIYFYYFCFSKEK